MKRIAIHSAPRSGSSWLGSLFDAHPKVAYRFQPMFSYAFKNYLKEGSTQKEIENFFKSILDSTDSFINQTDLKAEGKYPSFIKLKSEAIVYKEVRYHHLLLQMLKEDKHLRLIALVRDPRAMLNSWSQAPKEFQAGWDFSTEWRKAKLKNRNRIEEFNGFDQWLNLSALFLKLKNQYPKRVYVLKYETLLENTAGTIKELMNFSGLELDENQLNFINRSRSKHDDNAYSVFKTKSTDKDWIGQLPAEIANEIQSELKGTELEQFLNGF